MPTPSIWNWATCGSPYEEVAHTNALTFKVAGSEPHTFQLSGEADWLASCNLKPRVAIEILDSVAPGEGVLLLDADATIEKPIPWPELQGRLGGGPCFAYVLHHKPSGAREVLSGTLWLTKTPECRDILDRWLKLCQERPTEWDQRSLAKVIGGYSSPRGGRQVQELDWHWAWIEGITDRPRSGAHIVHHQMSRQVRVAEDTKEKERENVEKPPEPVPTPERGKGKKSGKNQPGVQAADAGPGAGQAPGVRA
jgi:hypothetical protein